MIKSILSFVNSGHPSNHPTKPRWVRHKLGALCRLLHSWAGQSRSAAPSQTCAIKGMLPWKRDGVPNGSPKIISERPKPSVRQTITSWWFALWLHQTASLSKCLSESDEKVCTPPSSARVGRHQLWTPPRSSESFPHSTLSSSDSDKTHSMSFPNKPKMQTCTVVKLLYGNMEMMMRVTTATGKQNKLRKIARDEMPKNSQEYLSVYSWNTSLKFKSKEYCQLENFLFFRFPIPTISYQRFSFTRPRIADKLELLGFFYLLLGPSQTLTTSSFFQWHRNHNQNSELKAVERVFLPWKACLSGAIQNFWEGKSLALHVPNSLLQCHFHEQKDLPRKL